MHFDNLISIHFHNVCLLINNRFISYIVGLSRFNRIFGVSRVLTISNVHRNSAMKIRISLGDIKNEQTNRQTNLNFKLGASEKGGKLLKKKKKKLASSSAQLYYY